MDLAFIASIQGDVYAYFASLSTTTLWTAFALIALFAAWRHFRDLPALTPIRNRTEALWRPLKRLGRITSPYWLAHGKWSVAGLVAVLAIFVGTYLALQAGVSHLDDATKWVTAQLASGVPHFLIYVCLPAVLGCVAVWFIGKWLWPKNENASGLLLLTILLMLMASVNSINAVLNYAYGDITNAAVHKLPVYWMLVIRLGVMFAGGTIIVVMYSYANNRLRLSWRRWLTRYYMKKYFANRNYYRINWMPNIDNPDERIANDIDSVTSTSLDLLLTVLGGIITYTTFIGILNQVDPTHYWLAMICYGWSAFFTIVSLFFGKKLVSLNYNQLRREADFRYNLIHVRNNTESIAFYRGEEREAERVDMKFTEVLSNWDKLIGWTRNFGFVSTGSDYFTAAIPYLFLGSMLLAGTVEVGAINQVSFAFGQVLSALTLVVMNFRTLSAFTATINRLAMFVEALDEEPVSTGGTIASTQGDKLVVDKMTLFTPDRRQELVRGLSFELKPGERIVVMGRSGVGKSSLMRGFAGLPGWDKGGGSITRPALENSLFLPQRPYMGIGSLRELLLYPNTGGVSDDTLLAMLKTVNLAYLAPRYAGTPLRPVNQTGWLGKIFGRLFGSRTVEDADGSKANANGLSTMRNWAEELSLGEQQRIGFARLLLTNPKVAYLDEATSALDVKNEEDLYAELKARGISCISVGHRPTLVKFHDRKLELTGVDGGWTLESTQTPSS